MPSKRVGAFPKDGARSNLHTNIGIARHGSAGAACGGRAETVRNRVVHGVSGRLAAIWIEVEFAISTHIDGSETVTPTSESGVLPSGS